MLLFLSGMQGLFGEDGASMPTSFTESHETPGRLIAHAKLKYFASLSSIYYSLELFLKGH